MKPRFLFVNPRQANCSIYKSGRQIYDALAGSDNWTLDYVEIPNIDIVHLHAGRIVVDGVEREPYDVIIFNYHDITMRGMEGVRSEFFANIPSIKYSIILEMETNNPLSRLFSDDFDGYLVMDPTMKYSDPRFHAFPRPIPAAVIDEYQHQDIPVIGSFGFATQDKAFDHIVEAAGREFDRAIVRINIPKATYADPEDLAYRQIVQQCQAAARPGITVEFSREFFTDAELVRWCSRNTLNCFLYTRNMPGLAAVTDQAIASGRPLAISNNPTFRHIHNYVQPYPLISLQQSMDNIDGVKRMQEDWSWAACQRRLTEILFEEE